MIIQVGVRVHDQCREGERLTIEEHLDRILGIKEEVKEDTDQVLYFNAYLNLKKRFLANKKN